MAGDLLSICEQSQEDNLLKLCYSDVSWDLSDIVFSPFLDKPESTNDHWDSCCFYFPCFLKFYFEILVLEKFFLLLFLCIYSQCSTGSQFLEHVTSCSLSSRQPVGGFVLFLIGQSFESEPHQDSPQCFQDGQLILLGLSQVP